MNKSDLIGKMASDAGITKAQAQAALNSFVKASTGALKKGDKVVTTGGVIGTVHTLQDDYVVLKVGEGETKLEVLRSSITGLRS